ncbi:tail tape measure protein [Sphingomonas baiyangensis]|uniref:Tail tape measure protein n=1 Tax=Sphingomonas baiyangensis TaxID=2572576 RepID=A0A4U1L518_9SPHN|nr:tail tape measure protein [Sphingomonas baiyangensis]TKD51654.1 tail tape measure protein [Sphingomonas baiyangensis]
MDEEIERLVVQVRADTQSFARDMAVMQRSLDGPFAAGVDRAGRVLEGSLLRAVRTGQLGFEDLGKVALRVIDGIAASAVRSGLDALLGGGGASRERGGGLVGAVTGSGGGGLLGALTALLSGAPGRATGGPVSPERPYWVGERGPELFVPTASGRIEALPAQPASRAMVVAGREASAGVSEARGAMQAHGTRATAPARATPMFSSPAPLPREVRVAITINAPPGAAPAMLARSGRQVARELKHALAQVE